MTVPAVSTEVLQRLHYYRTVCGLPCHVDGRGRVAVVVGGSVRAVTMPEYWGYQVRELLSDFRMLGPVIWHPLRRLTFLTGAHRPEDGGDHRVDIALLRTESVIVPPNDMIALPSPGDNSRGWTASCRDGFRPGMTTVLDALVECAAREWR